MSLWDLAKYVAKTAAEGAYKSIEDSSVIQTSG